MGEDVADSGMSKFLYLGMSFDEVLLDSRKNAVKSKQRIVSRLTVCRGKRVRARL